MKTCPVCALDLEDSFLYCPDDGSTLTSRSAVWSNSETTSDASPDKETTGAVVLYCPTCAAEYPLTFSSCPVHGVTLTKHRIPKSSSSESKLREPKPGSQATVSAPRFRTDETKPAKQLTVLDLKRPHIEGPILKPPGIEGSTLKPPGIDASTLKPPGIDGSTRQPASLRDDLAEETTEDFRFNSVAAAFDGFDYQDTDSPVHERRLDRPGFRVAAIATVILLAIFGLVAIYTLFSNLSRRSASSTTKTASAMQDTSQPQPFVATPKEAQEYKEEPPAVSPAAEQPPEPTIEPARRERIPASPSEPGVRVSPNARPTTKTQAAVAPPQSVAPPRISNPTMPSLPQGNSGGFDARLVRVRSRKTSAGVRYDLTFNMQEQAGRAAHWQRVLISTRSASGSSHSEAIPFSHRLGAAGALTFTISVELTGRSEADWQGRIVCTTLGWDNKGGPLQASFGANVTP